VSWFLYSITCRSNVVVFSLKIPSHDLRKYERLRVRYQELGLRDAELELNASAVVSGPSAAATTTTTLSY
jgi:hypothetical protein